MKIYHGRRTEHGCAVDVEEDGEVCLLNPRYDLRPDASGNLEWGSYASSGAVQLALALAADATGDDERARQVHQHLTRKLIGGLPQEGWVLTERQVHAAIEAIEHEQTRSR